MIISHRKKFIFIHIYKTGGTSVTSLFLPYARFIERISTQYWFTRKSISVINKVFKLANYGNKWINGVNKHATALELKNYLGEDLYNNYFKFVFVRNPYDMQVSLYHYIKQDKDHHDNTIANQLSFKAFVLREIENKAPLQSSFIVDKNGNKIVDYIGKTETLNESLSNIADKVHIPYMPAPYLNKSIRKKEYMEYYDDDLKELVYYYYKKDFDMFGYDR